MDFLSRNALTGNILKLINSNTITQNMAAGLSGYYGGKMGEKVHSISNDYYNSINDSYHKMKYDLKDAITPKATIDEVNFVPSSKLTDITYNPIDKVLPTHIVDKIPVANLQTDTTTSQSFDSIFQKNNHAISLAIPQLKTPISYHPSVMYNINGEKGLKYGLSKIQNNAVITNNGKTRVEQISNKEALINHSPANWTEYKERMLGKTKADEYIMSKENTWYNQSNNPKNPFKQRIKHISKNTSAINASENNKGRIRKWAEDTFLPMSSIPGTNQYNLSSNKFYENKLYDQLELTKKYETPIIGDISVDKLLHMHRDINKNLYIGKKRNLKGGIDNVLSSKTRLGHMLIDNRLSKWISSYF
jgi:hypothetical protein